VDRREGLQATARHRHEGPAPLRVCRPWEGWKDPATEQWLRTFTIITTKANEVLEPIHPRMPVILKPADFELWLSLDRDAGELLRPYPSNEMETWKVSPRVNGSALDDAEMLNPLYSPLPRGSRSNCGGCRPPVAGTLSAGGRDSKQP
jgi:putative SOS response-associated peptidase YedK